MHINSISAFVPSGKEFDKSKQFFIELGFTVEWDGGDYIGFVNNNCRFILQNYYAENFAENFMLSVSVPDAAAFREEVLAKQLPEKFGIRISNVLQQPYGKEVNIIDIAGVCWHFVQG